MPRATPARIALYSHDSTGLGHVRRNLLLAQELGHQGHDVLLVTGSPEATAMTRPPGTDVVTLPSLRKDESGRYRARNLSLELHELATMRRAILASALTSFAPDLLVVDRHARGFLGELEPALDALAGTRVVLGLRDVLDARDRVRREWTEGRTAEALERWYEEIWVYGDPRFHRPLEAAGVAAPVPVLPLGYLAATRPSPDVADVGVDVPHPLALCMLGGGADGGQLATTVLEATLPPGLGLVLVTGPQMAVADRQRLTEMAAARPDVTVLEYLHEPMPLLRAARAAVVMGGYNTVCEALATGTPTLVVPRERPRMEQAIRARALAAAGLLDTMAPSDATSEQLGLWLAQAVSRTRHPGARIDLGGTRRVGVRARQLLAHPPRRSRRGVLTASADATSSRSEPSPQPRPLTPRHLDVGAVHVAV